MPDISVIIPLYNKAHTLRRAIESALMQQVDLEIVVVDDGSTDDSASVAQSFGEKVIVVHQDNAGPAMARNRAVAEARGAALAFLDADDEFLPGCLAAHLACRQIFTDVKTTLSPYRILVGDSVYAEADIHDRIDQFSSCGPYFRTDRFHSELARGVVSGAICVDRDLFDRVGGFDPELRCWEISDLLFRLFAVCPKVGVLDEIRVVVHGNLVDGQFQQTRRGLRARLVRARNILAHIDAIPDDQRPALLSIVTSSAKELLNAGAFDELRELSDRLDGRSFDDAWLKGLRLLGRLPLPVIRLARTVVLARSGLSRLRIRQT